MEPPFWLIERIKKAGGTISFHQYMDWSLNDPVFGFYGAGRVEIGKRGDFATSPSIGPEFASLLVIQIIDWLELLFAEYPSQQIFHIIEIGPGEGDLISSLILEIEKKSPNILSKIEIILVELSTGMMQLQKKNIMSKIESKVNIRWSSLNELINSPVIGIVVANEILDALPVERIIFRNKKLFRQGVSLIEDNNTSRIVLLDLPLPKLLENNIINICDKLNNHIPPNLAEDGWTTEWHCELPNWFNKVSKCLIRGPLLVIDYMLEFSRYYSLQRSSGTLIAYKKQIASSDFLKEPGHWDITSHLCTEIVKLQAQNNNLTFIGETRQGQALLALGLAKLFTSLRTIKNDKLNYALERRENLLRLVDPSCLGELRWLAFEKKNFETPCSRQIDLRTRFLLEPDKNL